MDLQMKEGSGLVTHDWAKPHHEVIDLNGPPTWSQRPNDLNYLEFDGVDNYLDCPAIDTADLDFTSGDYSIAGWYNIVDNSLSELLIGRYGVDLDGWEVYWYAGGGGQNYMSLRHHHASLAPDVRTGCFSEGWTPDVWLFMVITRSGAYPKMYRNGELVTVTYNVGGLNNPDTCNRDLVLGTRFSKDANWYQGWMWRPRIWNRELQQREIRFIYEKERGLLGV